MSTWSFTIAPGGDITSLVDVQSIVRTQRLFTELKPNVNKIEFRVKFTSALFATLTSNDEIEIAVTKDAAAYFTGVLSPNYKAQVRDGQRYISIIAEDYTLSRLGQTIAAPVAYAGYAVCTPAATSTSLVHAIATAAGVTLNASLPTISATIPYVVAIPDDKATWGALLSDILYEHGFVYYFNPDGTMSVISAINTGTISTTGTLTTAAGSTNIRGELEIEKSPERYDDIRVGYDLVELKTGIVLFQDTTGATDSLACNIPLAATGDSAGKDYYPLTSKIGEVFSAWKNPDGYEILVATSASLDATLGAGISLSSGLTNYYRKCSFAYHNTSGAVSNITKLRITGDAYVVTSKNVARSSITSAKKLLDIKAKYIFSDTDAATFAKALAQYYLYSDITYKAKSKTAFSIGQYIFVSDAIYSGLSNDCRVIGITEHESASGVIEYELEAVADYVAIAIDTEGEGVPGTVVTLPPPVPILSLSVQSALRSRLNTIAPATLTMSAANQDMSAYLGRFTVELSHDGVTYQPPVYTSSSDQPSYAYAIPATMVVSTVTYFVVVIRVSLYAAGGTTTLFKQSLVSVSLDASVSAIYWGSLTTAPTTNLIAGDYYFDNNNPASGGGKVRRYNGSTWVEITVSDPDYAHAMSVSAEDQLTWSQNKLVELEQATKLATSTSATLRQKQIYTGASLPASPWTGYVAGDVIIWTNDNYTLYRFTGSGWTKNIAGSDVSNIPMTSLASGIRPPRVVTALPANPYTGYAVGDTVVLNLAGADFGKLFRMVNMSGTGTTGWSKAVDAADITVNKLTAGQIAVGAIGADQVAANAITAEKIIAGARNSPNDPVAYWSFDDVPEIPDDPAGVTYLQDEWATTDGWAGVFDTVVSTENGKLKIVFGGGDSQNAGFYHKISTWNGKTSRVKVNATIPITNMRVYNGTVYENVPFVRVDDYTVIISHVVSTTYTYLFYRINENSPLQPCTVYVDFVYIGTGKYIDNGLVDNSGNGNHATIYGATPVPGISGNALAFDGVGDRIILPKTTSYPITFSVWLKTKASITPQIILAKGISSEARYSIYRNTDNQLSIRLRSVSTNVDITFTDYFISIEETLFMSIVFDYVNFSITAYKNGAFISTKSFDSSALLPTVDATPYIGAYPALSDYFTGTIDEPRIYDRALSEAEIKFLYENKVTNTGMIIADQIKAGAITAGKIAAGAVGANEILAGAITAGKIAAGAVGANEIDVGSLTADTAWIEEFGASSILAHSLIAQNAFIADFVATTAFIISLQGQNLSLLGTLKTGVGASDTARVAIKDAVGVTSKVFTGAGTNDLVLIADGLIEGTVVVTINEAQVGDIGPSGGKIVSLAPNIEAGPSDLACSGWDAAVSAASASTMGGKDDWSLPTRAQLQSIRSLNITLPKNNMYWTSETSGSQAYAVDIATGITSLNDKTRDIFEATKTMPNTMNRATLQEYNGKLYFPQEAGTKLEIYDIATDTFVTKTMPNNMNRYTSQKYNGKLYFPEYAGARLEIYDIATDTFVTKTMPNTMGRLTSQEYNGKLYFPQNNGTKLEIYDIATDTFVTKTMPNTMGRATSQEYNGKLYFPETNGTKLEIYDIATDTFVTKTMYNDMYRNTSQEYNGKLYFPQHGGTKLEIYDIATDTFEATKTMPNDMSRYTSQEYNGKLYFPEFGNARLEIYDLPFASRPVRTNTETKRWQHTLDGGSATTHGVIAANVAYATAIDIQVSWSGIAGHVTGDYWTLIQEAMIGLSIKDSSGDEYVSAADGVLTVKDIVVESGILSSTIQTVTTSATISAGAGSVYVNTADAVTLTIPAGLPVGRSIKIMRLVTSTNAITVARSGSETIEGATSFETHGAQAATTLNLSEVTIKKLAATDWRFVGGEVSGSNEYGSYRKFSDGTMECWGKYVKSTSSASSIVRLYIVVVPESYIDDQWILDVIPAYNIPVNHAVTRSNPDTGSGINGTALTRSLSETLITGYGYIDWKSIGRWRA